MLDRAMPLRDGTQSLALHDGRKAHRASPGDKRTSVMKTIVRSGTAFATIAMLTAFAGSASAQTAPARDRNNQQVREILTRAEAGGARRALSSILGSIAGPANAQTAPPPAPAPASAPAATPAIAPAADATPTPTPAVARAPVPVATQPGGSGAPVVTAQAAPAASPAPAGRGTPEDPSMLSTVPQAGAQAPVEAAPEATPVQPSGRAVVTSSPATVPVARRVIEVRPGYAPHRRYVRTQGWCAPYRW